MDTDLESKAKAARDRAYEAKVDARATKAAKEMQGHIHINRPLEENPVLQAANEVFRKARLRKVN
jgi:hypothetical protein